MSPPSLGEKVYTATLFRGESQAPASELPGYTVPLVIASERRERGNLGGAMLLGYDVNVDLPVCFRREKSGVTL